MTLIADILMIAGALGAAFYCMVLSRRLSRFTDLDKGIGGAIAVLSMQVDDMTKALDKARETAGHSAHRLDDMTARGEEIAKRLELLVASMHDLPQLDAAPAAAKTQPGAAAAKAEAAPAAAEPEPKAAPATIFSSKRLEPGEVAA